MEKTTQCKNTPAYQKQLPREGNERDAERMHDDDERKYPNHRCYVYRNIEHIFLLWLARSEVGECSLTFRPSDSVFLRVKRIRKQEVLLWCEDSKKLCLYIMLNASAAHDTCSQMTCSILCTRSIDIRTHDMILYMHGKIRTTTGSCTITSRWEQY